MKRKKLLVMGLALSLAMGLGLVSHAYTQNFSPTTATVQLWLDGQLTPPVLIESQVRREAFISPDLAHMISYQPTGDEPLEQGVVLNILSPDGALYRYTCYKGGLVACQVGGQTLWYQCPPLSLLRYSLLDTLTEAWAPPADTNRTLPLIKNYPTPKFTGDHDAPVELQWAREQIKVFDFLKDYTVYIEPGSYFETLAPIQVTDNAFRQRLLEMVSDSTFSQADRKRYTGIGTYLWVVGEGKQCLYEVSGNMISNYQVPGVLTCTYADRALGEELSYIRAVEYYRLLPEGK